MRDLAADLAQVVAPLPGRGGAETRSQRPHTSPNRKVFADEEAPATLPFLARWQQHLGNAEAARRLEADAERAWRAAAAWLERLRPGRSPADQAECRRLLQQATLFSTDPTAGEGASVAGLAVSLAGLPPDRRKLEAAVALAMARLEPGPATSEAMP